MKVFSRPKLKLAKPPLPCRRVVVMEDGARLFELPAHPNGPDETVLVAQWRNEPPEQFARRVLMRLATCERSGEPMTLAMLVVARELDPSVAWARASLVRALVSYVAASGSGELVLVATEAQPALRHELLAMVESLLEEHPESHVSMRLQFHVERPSASDQSGIHAIPGTVARGLLGNLS